MIRDVSLVTRVGWENCRSYDSSKPKLLFLVPVWNCLSRSEGPTIRKVILKYLGLQYTR